MKFNGIELKPGCIVKLKNKRGEYWNVAGKMDRYIGRVVTISKIYSADEGDFGRSRFLKPSEQEKYKKLFSEVIPEDLIDPTLFKYVDYCYYNCCEADDYYVKKDSFEEEI